MTILSIQSAVAYGHVGNSAAVFPLQRLGFEVWPVNTVQFSNHPGYGSFKGKITESSDLANMINGIGQRLIFPDCEAVLSGYLGTVKNGFVVRNTVLQAQEINPKALYCCDPIIGDWEEGIYVAQDIPTFIRDQLVPLADIITPNAFELEQLTGHGATTVEEAMDAARALSNKMSPNGPQIVVVTSLRKTGEFSEDTLETLAVSPTKACLTQTPRLELKAKGTGDTFTALFLGNYLKKRKQARALRAAVSSLYGIIEATEKAESMELHLIPAQREITKPSKRFELERLGS